MALDRLVHIVDDEAPVRRSIDFLLRSAGFRTQRWRDGEAFLKGVDGSVPACVLLDVRMRGMDGLQVQAEMIKRGYHFPVIMLTGDADMNTAIRAMRGGAVDFLEKPFNREHLLHALEMAATQENPEATCKRQDWARTRTNALTVREREVLECLAGGGSNKTVAVELGISPRTVEVHRANVMIKLNVSNFADLLRIAFAGGFGSD